MSVTTPTARLHDAVRSTQTDSVALASVDSGASRSGTAAATIGGTTSLANALRTLLDRALDAARGRFDP